MPNRSARRPEPADYPEYFAGYLSRVPEGDIVARLRDQCRATLDLLAPVSPETALFRYAPGKWSATEVMGHVIDMEWVFTYRALRFARGDATPLEGVDETVFMKGANFSDRTLPDVLDEYRHLRAANTALFDSFDDAILDRTGIANDARFSVRSLLFMLVGHELHHLEVLRTRYLDRA